MASLKYWLWLTQRRGLGGVLTCQLLERFGTPESAYFADPGEYELIPNLSMVVKNSLLDKSLTGAEQILSDSEKLGLRIMTLQDADYPERLRQLADAPAVLYIKGRVFAFDEEVAIGVVGARNATGYGIQTAGKFGLELARAGALVVSGIAQGIDAAVIRGALAGGGPVVSVLAGGVDVIYPKENRFLYEDVAAVGALMSEYPPGTVHKGEHFPIRNRIISGLSLGVVAVEGAERSGTLITARLALEQDRDIFAVPGNVDAEMSRGTNRLIQEGGALLVTRAGDVLREYEALFPSKIQRQKPLAEEEANSRLSAVGAEKRSTVQAAQKVEETHAGKTCISLKSQPELFTDDEKEILYALMEKSMCADDVIEETQIPARRVLSALTMLQVRGYVTEGKGRRFETQIRLTED